MASQVSNDAFKLIFPRYAQLLSEGSAPTNQSVEQFLREELPRKVEMVRNMESCFNAFLSHFTSIILKRPQHSHLIHSLILKANDKIQKYFQTLSNISHKLSNSDIQHALPNSDPQTLRKEFRSRLEAMGDLLREKYFCGGVLARDCEEEVAMRLYILFQMYHFLKGDQVTIAGKFRISEQDVLQSVSRNDEPRDIGSLVGFDSNFVQHTEEAVMKRCRPFNNRRETLQSKVREALREGESRVGSNLNLFLQSLLSKERTRVARQLSTSLTRELRSMQEGSGQSEVREMVKEVEELKREFAQVKNTSYFLDIMRGSFSQKYKMETHRLENVFYLTNLEKYLQDVATFLEKVLALEERVISNRKEYMRDFGSRVDIKISELISFYESKGPSSDLGQLIAQQFDLLESALYGVSTKKEVTVSHGDNRRQDRERREVERKRQVEIKAEEERNRREQEKVRIEEKRQKEDQRIRLAKIQREEKDRQRREQNDRLQQVRRAQLEKRRQQKSRKDEDQRRTRDEQMRKKQEEKKQKQKEDRDKRQNLARVKAEEQEKRNRQRQLQNKKKQDDKKRILERQQEDKRKREAEVRERKDREQKDRVRRQNQKKDDEDKLRREREQKQQQKQRKQQQRIRQEKERKDAEQRKKQEDKKRTEREREQNQERLKEERKRQQERKEQLKRNQQEQDRKAKEMAEQRKAEENEKKRQQQRKAKELKQQQQRDRKIEEERIANEKAQKARIEKEKKQKDERDRKERQRVEKQKQQKQRLQKVRLQEQKQQKQRLQKEKKQKQLKQEEDRKRMADQDKKQKQRKDAQQKVRLQKQRKEQQKRQKQQKDRQAEIERKRKEEQIKLTEKNKGKKEPKKSSGIDYGDLDDILDDDLEQMQRAGKLTPPGASGINIDEDYGDDFQSPDKGTELSTRELIGPEQIKCLNDYMKGTSYSRKNKVNAQMLNKSDKYLQVFEQFIQNRKMFVFNSGISKAVMQLGGELSNPDTIEEDLHMSIDTIKQEMLKAYDEVLPGEEMFPMTRYIYPFSFKNQFNIKVIQMIPAHTYFRIILDRPLPADQAINQRFQCLIEGILHIFQLEGEPSLEECVVNEESRMVLDTFDRELPCLLLLFAFHYQFNNPKEIIINQYTIERFFYTSNVILPLYDAIKEGEQLDEFYNNLFQKYSSNDKIKIHGVAVNSSDPEYNQQLAHSAMAIKQEFLTSKHSTVLTSFAIELEEEGEIADKVVLYMSMDRATPKPVVNYFLISKDSQEQENATVIFELVSEGDENFETNVFTDFTRHNCLGSYSDWSLPLWAHVITKRKLSSLQAMRAMAFAMTPYYLAFKGVD